MNRAAEFASQRIALPSVPHTHRTLAVHAHPAFPDSLPLPGHCHIVDDIAEAEVVVAFAGAEQAAEKAQVAGLPLIPLLSTSEDAPDWFDYRGADALSQGLVVARNILARMSEIRLTGSPVIGDLLLARLYSRQADMVATYSPATREMVAYPAAGPIYGVVECANRLAEHGLMTRHFFDRTFICRQCRSARLLAREECVECRSTQLSEQALVHHFRCGHEAPESTFKLGGNRFECPKCNRELRHIGLDYDKPGTVVSCGECVTVNDTAAVGFVCADCMHHHDADSVPHRDWNHFQMTPAAVHLLRTGGSSASPATAALDPLRVLVDQACSERDELGHPFQMVHVRFLAAPAIREHNPRVWERSHALTLDVIRSAVRRIDKVGAAHDGLNVFLAGLDETEAQKAIAAMRTRLAEVIETDLEPEFILMAPSAVHAWLHHRPGA